MSDASLLTPIHVDITTRQRRRISISVEKPISKINSCDANQPHDIEETGTALCCCSQSKAYPLCDGTHNQVNRANNSNFTPINMEATSLEQSSSKLDLRRSCHITGYTPKLDDETPNLPSSNSPKTNRSSDLTSTKKDSQPTTESQSKSQDTDKETKVAQSTPKKDLVIRKVDRKKITAEFTEEEVAKHNTKDDCWMIIKGHVYDVTAYFAYHPGGERALLKFAGKDGTENVQFHSSKMMELLNNYFYVGKLKRQEESSSCTIS